MRQLGIRGAGPVGMDPQPARRGPRHAHGGEDLPPDIGDRRHRRGPDLPRLAELPKIVFSRTLRPPLRWANTTVMADSVWSTGSG
jgi:hypothetical protein